MSAKIICRTTAKGESSFYVSVDGETHFLFSQNYHTGVRRYFRGPVSVTKAIDFSCAKGNKALIHTMEKLPSYIRYVEREYGIEVLKQTQRRNARRKAA